MHKIDTDGHVANAFDEGDPGVPRQPTQVDKHWLNAVQQELVNAVEGSGQALVKGTWDQLKKAIGLGGGSGGARAFAAALAGEFWNIINTGAGITVKLAGSGTTAAAAVLDLLNNSTGPILKGEGASVIALAKLKNFAAGPCLELEGLNGSWPLKLVPLTTLPTTNPAGGALSAADDGAIVYLAGAYNKLYCYTNSLGWVALS